MKRKGESFLEREGRMVKCEEEKNEENGERGGGRRFCSKEGGGHVWLGVIRKGYAKL